MLLTRTVSLDIFCNLTFQNGSQLSLLKIAEHIKIDNISITVLLASLVSSASNAQVVACITFRLYNICAEYVCMRSSAYSSSDCFIMPQSITKYHYACFQTPRLRMNICEGPGAVRAEFGPMSEINSVVIRI